MVRLDTVVLYSWPSEHRHQTERLLYGVTICGVRGSIFRFMPMRRNFRILAGKVIHARNYHLTGTYRTASAGGSGRNSCLPFMPFLALPPNLTPGTGHHIGWKKRSVFARVPLMDKLRVYGRQIVYAGHQQTHPLMRDLTIACQLCPFSQIHQALAWLPYVTRSGVSVPFFS